MRWTDLVRSLRPATVALVECGPGKVLTGLNRRIDRSASCYALDDAASITDAIEQVRNV